MNTQIMWSAAAYTDIGLCRKRNEDALVFDPEHSLFAVSDGMGGLPYGGETAQIVASMMKALFENESLQAQNLTDYMVRARYGIETISNAIRKRGNSDEDTPLYGATLSGFSVFMDHAVVFNVGDSRVYRLRHGATALEQITKDHSMVQALIDSGELTPEEAASFENRSTITRFMGMGPAAQVDITAVPLEAGDRFLVCTDGLHGTVEEEVLFRILAQSNTAEELCAEMIKAANVCGGRDNISAVVWVSEPQTEITHSNL